jgi:putative alpha-1,2-mannosidase
VPHDIPGLSELFKGELVS